MSSHPGVEPGTFGLEVQRAIHCANGTCLFKIESYFLINCVHIQGVKSRTNTRQQFYVRFQMWYKSGICHFKSVTFENRKEETIPLASFWYSLISLYIYSSIYLFIICTIVCHTLNPMPSRYPVKKRPHTYYQVLFVSQYYSPWILLKQIVYIVYSIVYIQYI